MEKRQLCFKLVISLACLALVIADEEESKSKKDSVGTVIGIDLGTTYSW